MSVSNQSIIQNFIYEPCNKDNLYATINLDALQSAMNELNTIGAFKLWLYLSKNAKSFNHLELSKVACEEWGIKKTAYYEGRKELMAKGYLVENGGYFDFIQFPDSGIRTKSEEKEFRIPENGKEIPDSGQDFPENGLDCPDSGREILQDYTIIQDITLQKLFAIKDPSVIKLVGEEGEWVYVELLDSKRKIKIRKG